MGGLARTATIVENLRAEKSRILLLDCGGVFARNGKDIDLKAEVALRTMNMLNYDAINIGASELRFGPDYLARQKEELSLPLLSSNLKSANDETPSWLKRYVIKPFGDIRVGIVGVLPTDALRKTGYLAMPAEPLSILNPETALKKLLPEVKKNADIIVLLSQLKYTETSDLLARIPEIDMAIACDKNPAKRKKSDSLTPHPVYEGNTKGFKIGMIQLKEKKPGKISSVHQEFIGMDNPVLLDMRVVNLISELFSERWKEERELRAQKRTEEMHQKMLQGLKMSPEEFIKQNKDISADPNELEQFQQTFQESKNSPNKYEITILPKDCNDKDSETRKE